MCVLRAGREVTFSERADQAQCVLGGGSALALTLKILKSFHLEMPEAKPVSIMLKPISAWKGYHSLSNSSQH